MDACVYVGAPLICDTIGKNYDCAYEFIKVSPSSIVFLNFSVFYFFFF